MTRDAREVRAAVGVDALGRVGSGIESSRPVQRLRVLLDGAVGNVVLGKDRGGVVGEPPPELLVVLGLSDYCRQSQPDSNDIFHQGTPRLWQNPTVNDKRIATVIAMVNISLDVSSRCAERVWEVRGHARRELWENTSSVSV